MPKAQLHWTYDLLAVALVGGISGLVFWLLPPAELANTTAFSTSMEFRTCSVAIS